MQNAIRQETLLLVIDRPRSRILLAMKKVRFGAGKYNGMGGKIEEGERPAQAAVREALEEAGVEVMESDAVKMGEITFSFEAKPEWTRCVHIFTSESWAGEPVESDEMAPEWFGLDAVPYDKMWIDDMHWLPRVLGGAYVNAEFHFNNDGSEILRHDIRERKS